MCYCLTHNNRKSDFSKHCIKNGGYVIRLFNAAKLVKPVNLSRLHPRLPGVCLKKKNIFFKYHYMGVVMIQMK